MFTGTPRGCLARCSSRYLRNHSSLQTLALPAEAAEQAGGRDQTAHLCQLNCFWQMRRLAQMVLHWAEYLWVVCHR